jgi:hypothetical protein
LESVMAKSPVSVTPKLLSVQAATDLLDMPPRRLRENWESWGLTAYRAGREIRFFEADVLSHAGGLSAGKHRFWAAAAADEKRWLAVLKKELTVERGWRGQLGATDVTLAREIAAAGNLPSLAGNVKSWKAQMKAHQHTISEISRMLGYSNAFIAAHSAPPKLPPIVHQFGGDVGDRIGAFLASVMAPFARGGMVKSYDNGGWLQPGLSMAYNGTGRPERPMALL